MIVEPSLFFNKDKRTIKFHFDMMHGQGNLDKAIEVLDQKEKQMDYAILFSNRIDVWSEPNQLGELLFSLHEGTKFQIIDDLAEWQKIRIANGSEGWVKNVYLRKLN